MAKITIPEISVLVDGEIKRFENIVVCGGYNTASYDGGTDLNLVGPSLSGGNFIPSLPTLISVIMAADKMKDNESKLLVNRFFHKRTSKERYAITSTFHTNDKFVHKDPLVGEVSYDAGLLKGYGCLVDLWDLNPEFFRYLTGLEDPKELIGISEKYDANIEVRLFFEPGEDYALIYGTYLSNHGIHSLPGSWHHLGPTIALSKE